ncbi:MAG: hypothetical protein ACK4RK_21755 [Gemmataceae bacterium]
MMRAIAARDQAAGADTTTCLIGTSHGLLIRVESGQRTRATFVPWNDLPDLDAVAADVATIQQTEREVTP